jgi:hypothetical protein
MHRSSDLQARLYYNYRMGLGGLAAPPGRSRHEIGQAADLGAGADLDWLHAHAGEFGLEFLPGYAGSIDPGHIQLGGAGTSPSERWLNGLSSRILRMPEHPHSAIHHVTINLDGKRVATAVQKTIVDSNQQVRGPSNYDGRSIPTPVDSGYQFSF